MSSETAEVRTTAMMLRPDQIVAVDEVKALKQRRTHGSVSRSDVVRDALDRALPVMKSELEAEAEVAMPAQPAGP